MNQYDNHSETETLLQNIARLRQKHGLSKKEMAKRLGIGLYTLNKIEKGQIPPRMGANIFFAVYAQFGILPSALVSQLLEDEKPAAE